MRLHHIRLTEPVQEFPGADARHSGSGSLYLYEKQLKTKQKKLWHEIYYHKKTGYIKYLNLTMRQRVSRFVRKTLSFSESMENHTGAVWNFVHH